ncbi:MAG: glycoside hydrolase family 3 C-terminal domain-containing protein [Lachnospiraceae bacterium]|nr:glycoside hydrolase family 3 C-terminal domain-containing protein [Lachnospiraceae bacterium]
MKTQIFTGTKSNEVRTYEEEHRKAARIAAAEGFVLLKNENNILPIDKAEKIALYGPGAGKTIKGGTGSGDVNERYSVSIYQGLKDAGYMITTEDWIESYGKEFDEKRLEWKDTIWKKVEEEKLPLFDAYVSKPFSYPSGEMPKKTDADTAIYVLSRVAGEGCDRYDKKGDYYLTEEENKFLKGLCGLYKNVVLVLNAGGAVDLTYLEEYKNIRCVIQMSQAGCEGGAALSDVISGKVNFCGKLTDTWAFRYGDYPNSPSFSHNNGNVYKELYEEGIFVGYRYFDTFGKKVRYGFGYGLSYTEFCIETLGMKHYDLGTDHAEIGLDIAVTNTGERAGKEVVQVYVSCPQGKQGKEYRRLVGFEKTKELAPGERQQFEIRFPLYALASYMESEPGWVLEQGIYGIFVGNSLESSLFSASLKMQDDFTMVKTEHICRLKQELKELKAPSEEIERRRGTWMGEIGLKPSVILGSKDMVGKMAVYGTEYEKIPEKIKDFVDTLSREQLIRLATGDPSQVQGSGNLGAAGFSVPGAAAQTSGCAKEQGLSDYVLADGPAGLRLQQTYFVKEGKIQPEPFEKSLEKGFLCKDYTEPEGEKYYQYCTAFPVGTLLAQTWDREMVRAVGKAAAEEMAEFHVTLWLAPGMNIHRNPLCGRNFEYFSEDPVLSGEMAAAVTLGVQSIPGCGTTIKHFACNNQEDNRIHSDSVVSERTLREIYLKGFEIAVAKSQPMAMMTSYNLINGVHAANNFDLCTKAARNEWGFKGLIMTDWLTTNNGPECTASGCMRAGNDIVMPGLPADHENMEKELAEGTLDIRDLKKSICRVVETGFMA